MGYLARKLRRRTAARDARAFAAAATADWPAATRVPPPDGFVRLALADGEGLFQAAYALRRSGELAREDFANLCGALRWFQQQLDAHDPEDERGVFWFNAGATNYLRRVWPIVGVLQRHGCDVRMLTSRRRPGRVLFADAVQIAAVNNRSPEHRSRQLATVPSSHQPHGRLT